MSNSRPVTLSEPEIACLKRLAELYREGKTFLTVNDPSLVLPAETREAILGTMENLGIIDRATHAIGLRFVQFNISANSVQVARQIQEQESAKKEPEDIVEQLKGTAKSKPVLAWLIIAFVVLAAAVTFANQLLDLLTKLGVIKLQPK
jgi:hypothetical protein